MERKEVSTYLAVAPCMDKYNDEGNDCCKEGHHHTGSVNLKKYRDLLFVHNYLTWHLNASQSEVLLKPQFQSTTPDFYQ